MKELPFNLKRKFKSVAKIVRADYEAIRTKSFGQARFLGYAWCNPKCIKASTRYFAERQGGFLLSSKELPKESMVCTDGVFIASGDWDTHTTPIYDVKHIVRTTHHFETGTSWADVGEIEWMMSNVHRYGEQDGCRNLDEVLARCSRLDKVMENCLAAQRMLTRKEISLLNFRENLGIGVIIDRDGEVIWFTDGAHRLAIAKHLELKEIPVCIHLVHAEAINNNTFMKNLYTRPKFR